jgi:NhaP-type Na+/H+ or K+/H+ antiporter
MLCRDEASYFDAVRHSKKPPSSSSWIVSAASVALVAFAVSLTLTWHGQQETREEQAIRRRVLLEQQTIDESPATFDDDFTRDETCRKYLVNFLNGTTDARDECQAYMSAFQAADCKDDSNLSFLDWLKSFFTDGELGRKHRLPNGTVVTDDVVIDDYYEKWECCSSISEFYAKHCEEPTWDAFQLLGIVAVLVTCGLVKSVIKYAGLGWVPDAGACIVVGSVVGGLIRLAVDEEVVRDTLTFDSNLFLQILLPPIIFEAALSIDKRAFRRDLFPILTFAIAGTGVSAVAIGYITYALSAWSRGTSLPLLDSLLFGALMSSVDPVATLSILSSTGVSRSDTLYTLIFGESLLNDGVSIVLFDSLVRHMGDADVVDAATVSDTLADFFVVSMGSIAVGVACGALCTLYFWALHGQHSAVTEVALFFCWALIPYYVADGMGLSGIIAIMVMGFMMDYFVLGGFQSDEGEWMEYMQMRVHHSNAGPTPVESRWDRCRHACSQAFSGRGHVLNRSRHNVGFVAKVISHLMETAIFAYLGLFLFNDKSWRFDLIFSGMFSCVASRVGMILVFAQLINACVWMDLEGCLVRTWRMMRQQRVSRSWDDDSLIDDTKVYLDLKTQLILFSAGVRGAVSYALVQHIPVYDSVTKTGSHFKTELRAMTSATIVVLLFALGALTYVVVQRDMGRPNREGVASSLTDRLMSTLSSDVDGNDSSEEFNSSLSLEIDGRSPSHNARSSSRGGEPPSQATLSDDPFERPSWSDPH